MTNAKRPWRLGRLWLPALFVIVSFGSWSAGPTHQFWQAARAGLVFYMLWRIINNNGKAFHKIHTARDEQVVMMQGIRLAAESLALSMEVILDIVKTLRAEQKALRAELAKNTTITNHTAVVIGALTKAPEGAEKGPAAS